MLNHFFILLSFLIGAANWQANANKISSADVSYTVGLYESFNSFNVETKVRTQDAHGKAAL